MGSNPSGGSITFTIRDKMNQFYNIFRGNIESFVEREELPKVHCVVTSPPYFKQRTYGNNNNEIGREDDCISYIYNLVTIFANIPLHDKGSLWINIGDKRNVDGSLMNIPSKFSNAMIGSGWKLADSVVWAKVEALDNGTTNGGCMTEPANGRLNGNGYEMFYRFVKCSKVTEAWTDTCAVMLPRRGVEGRRYLPQELMSVESNIEGRNLPNVWRVTMGQTKNKHYAVYPTALCERPIAMTCPILVNPDGSLVRRLVEKKEYDENRGNTRVFGKYNDDTSTQTKKGRQDTGKSYVARKPVTVGWSEILEGASPGIVLDPFCGTGTTGEVALKLGRSFIGVELYDEYADISEQRCQEALGIAQKYDIVKLITECV